MIHKCEIRHGGGGTVTRMLASRENVRGPLADFDVLALCQRDGQLIDSRRFTIHDFPRAHGVLHLFGVLLENTVKTDNEPGRDEHGDEVPLPPERLEDWRLSAQYHAQMAHHALNRIDELERSGRSVRRRVKAVQR